MSMQKNQADWLVLSGGEAKKDLTNKYTIGTLLIMNPSELVKWRRSQGYTQQGLATLLGVTKTTVYRWEKAMREIPPFLHLALRSLEKKGGGEKAKRARKDTPKRRG